jgi:hypothetical protein
VPCYNLRAFDSSSDAGALLASIRHKRIITIVVVVIVIIVVIVVIVIVAIQKM